MFSKSEAARAMKQEGIVKEFEHRSRLFEEAERVAPGRVRNFLDYISGSWLEKALGKRAISKLKDAAERSAADRRLKIEPFLSVEDGHVELLLPVMYRKNYTGLLKKFVGEEKAHMERVGSARIADYRGLANITAKVAKPRKLRGTIDVLETPPDGLEVAGIEYGLHVHHSARPPRATSAASKGKDNPSRAALYRYLEEHDTITSKILSGIANIRLNHANVMLAYDAKKGMLKRSHRGEYGLAGKISEVRASRPHRDSSGSGLKRGELRDRLLDYLKDHETIKIADLVVLGAKNEDSAESCIHRYAQERLIERVSKGIYGRGPSFPRPPGNGNHKQSTGNSEGPGLPLVAPIVEMHVPKEPHDYKPVMSDPIDRTYVVVKYFASRGGAGGYAALVDEVLGLGVDRKELDELVKTGYLEYAERNRKVTLTAEGARWLGQHKPGAKY